MKSAFTCRCVESSGPDTACSPEELAITVGKVNFAACSCVISFVIHVMQSLFPIHTRAGICSYMYKQSVRKSLLITSNWQIARVLTKLVTEPNGLAAFTRPSNPSSCVVVA